jgi:CubicO group peptidase (beta-lactamase class C family)
MASAIFEPIGMENSTFLRAQVPDSLSTLPHVYDFTNYRMGVSDVYPYNRPHAGSSTLHSNIEDMLRWAFYNLYRGNYHEEKILDEQVFDTLWNKKYQIGEKRYIGLSWFISDYNGKTIISHAGGDTGFRSYLALIPGDTTAVITMGNSDNFQSYGITRLIMDILYEFPTDTLKVPASASFLSIWGIHGLDSAYRYFRYLKENRDPFLDFDDGSLIMLAWPLFEKGDSETAIKLLELNSRLFPQSIWNLQFKAEVLYGMDRKEEAIESLKEALEINPQDTYSLSLLKQYRSN